MGHLFVPYRCVIGGGGDYRFPRRLSVRLSVSPLGVRALGFPIFFLSRPLRYSLEIWCLNLSWHNTDQARVSWRFTHFHRSYNPLLKLSFSDFSLLSFEILTWNLVTFDLLVQELLPFAKIQFSGFFSAAFWDIELKFGLWIFWLNTDQVRVWSSLTYFYRSYWPLLEFSFQTFYMQSFEILT